MPNWKKLVVSGSDAHLNSLNVATSVTSSFFKGDGSALTNITASYFAEGLVTASSASDTITFTKDNGDTFDVSIISASYALTASHGQNLTVSGSIAGADYIDFSTTGSVPYNEGRLFYDNENGALAFYNEEAEITLQIGQEFYKRVFNNTGGVISNGTPVRISGSQGDVPYIWPAFSSNIYSGSYDPQINRIIGLATHDIGINEVGYVTEFGIVRGIDTTAFAAGDQLFLQTGSAGFRNTPPPFPYDIVPVGEVIRSQANGFIEVRTSEPITHKNISGVNNIETQVISDESVTIQRGTPVHVVSEGDGPIPRVKIAKANDSNLMPATFVVEDEIPSGSQGTAVSIGYIYDVDTSAFAVGDVIYVASNGGYTNQKPTGSDLIQNLGVVLKISATEGSGFVYGAGRSNDVPNIPENYLWIGNANGVATPVSTGSLSGSFLLNTTDTFTGDLTVTGKVTAQEFHTEFISSSIIYQSGSTKFGDTSDDVHQFTGSLSIQSGSISLKDDYSNIVIGEGASAETPTQLNTTLNVVIGGNAGNPDDLSISKTGNVIIGDSAKMPRGGANVLIGRNVMSNSGTGLASSNVAIGAYAMQFQNGANENVAIGYTAGATLTSGDQNILIGYSADPSAGTDSNSIVIGHTATGKGSNTTVIGKSGATTHTYLEGLITGSSLEIGGDITGSNALFNGTVNATGDVVAYYSSDERFKDNIVEIENAVEKVESIRGVEFDWNDKQDTYTGHDIGVIAQEVEAILPEIVATRDNGYKAVKYEKLTALLLTAVKELSERVKTLEGK